MSSLLLRLAIFAPSPQVVVVASLSAVAASLPFLAAVQRSAPAGGSFYFGLHQTHRALSLSHSSQSLADGSLSYRAQHFSFLKII